MKKITTFIFFFMFCFVANYTFSQSGTINFSTTNGTNIGASINDGDWGSTDISSGFSFNIYIGDGTGEATGGDMEYRNSSGNEGIGKLNEFPDGTFFREMILKSSDGSEFDFNGFRIHNQYLATGVRIEGYRNGTSTGSTSISLNLNENITYDDSTFSDTIFGFVDEVRIIRDTNPVGTMNVLLDDFVIAPISVVSWTGNTNNDWSTASNWEGNSVPTSTDNVVIPSTGVTNYPTISIGTNITVNSVTLQSGATLIAEGTATLTGELTYNKTIPNNNWQLIAWPVLNEYIDDAWISANNISTSGTGNNTGIGYHLEATDSWGYRQAGDNFFLNQGYGLSLKQNAAGNVFFSGDLAQTDIATTFGMNISGNGFNLVGNPYPSYISSATFLNDNASILENNTIWVWNSATESYETYVTVDDYIVSPAQAFFVKADVFTPANFAESNQSHVGTFTSTKSEPNTQVKLFVNDGTKDQFARFYFIDDVKVTKGFDNGYDGESFGGQSNAFEVYSHLLENNNNKKYQLQSLPKKEMDSYAIPIGIKSSAGKEITFTIETINFPTELNVYIEDRQTGEFKQLDETNSEYKVTLSENLDAVGRFYLHTKSSVLGVEENLLNSVSIFTTNKATLRIAGLPQGKASVKLFNIQGKEVLQSSFSNSGTYDIDLPKLTAGVYIVQLATENGNINKKITLE